ncbi:hypothetical protein pb186bvf_000835 [Paramecium bursaria]
MGAQQSQSQQFLQEFNNQFTKIKEFKDLRFGDIQVYKNNQQMIIVKNQWCNNEKEYESMIAQCEKRSKLIHDNLLKLQGYHSNQSNQLCGDISKISIYLEYFEMDLSKVLDIRRNQQQFFNEAELWKMFYTIMSLSNFLDRRGFIIGDIRPCNIYLSADIKIAEYNIVPQDQNGFQRAYYNSEKAYLAPELLVFLNQHLQIMPQLQQKQDVFSLGIMLLECATLCQGRDFYNNNQIDYNLINAMIDQMRVMGYSATLFRMIREMLKERVDERPSFYEIQEVLQPFEQLILSKQPFQLQQQLQQNNRYMQTIQAPPQQHTLPPQPIQRQSIQAIQPTYLQQQIPQIPQQQQQTYQQSQIYQQPPKIAQSQFTIQQPVQIQYDQLMSPIHNQYYEQQSPIQPIYQQYEQEEDLGLQEIDLKIQDALKRTRETELRNQQTPNYY